MEFGYEQVAVYGGGVGLRPGQLTVDSGQLTAGGGASGNRHGEMTGNVMKRIGLMVCLVLALGAFAQEKVEPVSEAALFNELAAVVGPSRCVRVGEFDGAPGWGDLWLQRVRYRVIENGVVRVKDAAIVAEFKGLPEENAWWLEEVPGPLREAPEAEADPLGTDVEILAAVGGVVLKAEIERHPVVADSLPSATVSGYREVDGKPTEFKVVVYSKGGTLVSNEPVDKATAAAAPVEAVK